MSRLDQNSSITTLCVYVKNVSYINIAHIIIGFYKSSNFEIGIGLKNPVTVGL